MQRLESNHPKSLAAVHARAALEFERIEAGLPRAKRPELAAIRTKLTNLLDALKPHASEDIEAGTTFNDAVSLIRENKKLQLEADYIFKEVDHRTLWISVPHSRRWWSPTSGQIIQWNRDSMPVRRITFDERTPSTNPKGWCNEQAKDEFAYRWFSKVRREKSGAKGKLNRNIPKCYYYSKTGDSTEGGFLEVRNYHFVSKFVSHVGKTLYQVTIQEWVKQKRTDPAGAFVIASIIEKPKKKD